MHIYMEGLCINMKLECCTKYYILKFDVYVSVAS